MRHTVQANKKKEEEENSVSEEKKKICPFFFMSAVILCFIAGICINCSPPALAFSFIFLSFSFTFFLLPRLKQPRYFNYLTGLFSLSYHLFSSFIMHSSPSHKCRQDRRTNQLSFCQISFWAQGKLKGKETFSNKNRNPLNHHFLAQMLLAVFVNIRLLKYVFGWDSLSFQSCFFISRGGEGMLCVASSAGHALHACMQAGRQFNWLARLRARRQFTRRSLFTLK